MSEPKPAAGPWVKIEDWCAMPTDMDAACIIADADQVAIGYWDGRRWQTALSRAANPTHWAPLNPPEDES